MKTLIIPDIHTHYRKVQRIIEQYKETHKFIFMGDYFDQFGDTPQINQDMAEWLISTMNGNPDWIFLKGNHDEIYDPRTICMCSGYSHAKKDYINKLMRIEDWDKLKYFHYENGWYFSHAGITKYWFHHPMNETITPESVQRSIDAAVVKQRMGKGGNAIWASGYARGGDHVVGGIVWQDWFDLELIDGINQIVGHTPVKQISINKNNLATNINVDTSGARSYFHQLLELDEKGEYSIIENSNL
jgi:hypothetical protein